MAGRTGRTHPVSEAELAQLQQIVISVLGMPRSGVGCLVVLIDDPSEGGERLRMLTIGLSTGGVVHALSGALSAAMNNEPDASSDLKPTVKQ